MVDTSNPWEEREAISEKGVNRDGASDKKLESPDAEDEWSEEAEERDLTSWGLGDDIQLELEPEAPGDLDQEELEEGLSFSPLFTGLSTQVAEWVNRSREKQLSLKELWDAHRGEVPDEGMGTLILIKDAMVLGLRPQAMEGGADSVGFMLYAIATSENHSLLGQIILSLQLEPLKALCKSFQTSVGFQNEEIRSVIRDFLNKNPSFKSAEEKIQKDEELNPYDDFLTDILQENYFRYTGMIGLFFIDQVTTILSVRSKKFNDRVERAKTFLELSYEQSRATPELADLIKNLKETVALLSKKTKESVLQEGRQRWVKHYELDDLNPTQEIDSIEEESSLPTDPNAQSIDSLPLSTPVSAKLGSQVGTLSTPVHFSGQMTRKRLGLTGLGILTTGVAIAVLATGRSEYTPSTQNGSNTDVSNIPAEGAGELPAHPKESNDSFKEKIATITFTPPPRPKNPIHRVLEGRKGAEITVPEYAKIVYDACLRATQGQNPHAYKRDVGPKFPQGPSSALTINSFNEKKYIDDLRTGIYADFFRGATFLNSPTHSLHRIPGPEMGQDDISFGTPSGEIALCVLASNYVSLDKVPSYVSEFLLPKKAQ